jgi:hypothetical protein
MDHFYLHVESLVPENQSREFEHLMVHFRGRDKNHEFFSRIVPDCGYKLRLGLRTARPTKVSLEGLTIYSGRKPDPGMETYPRVNQRASVQMHVNLWQVKVPDAEDLKEGMDRMVDDTNYMKLNQLLLREEQNFVRNVAWQRSDTYWDQEKHEDDDIFRVVRAFPLMRETISEYLFDLVGFLPLCDAHGLHLAYQLQPITGVLGTVTEYWTVEGGKETLPEKVAAIRKEIRSSRYNRIARLVLPSEAFTQIQWFSRASYGRSSAGKKKS